MAQNRLYEDIKPPYEWARDERSDTLILHVEGFSRSQLRVQIMSTRKVRVSGERPKEGNTWCRFYLELPIPSDSDTNDISAKFDKNTLFVRFPKVITPVAMPQPRSPPTTQQAPPPSPPPSPPKPTTREEPKAEVKEKEPETMDETKMEQRKKEQPKEKKKEEEEDISKGEELMEEAEAKAKAKTKDKDHKQAEETRRASFSEGFSSKQAQDAIADMVGKLKKQKNVINRLFVVFVVLLLGLYLNHLVKSTFGGSKSYQEL